MYCMKKASDFVSFPSYSTLIAAIITTRQIDNKAGAWTSYFDLGEISTSDLKMFIDIITAITFRGR